jgi:hypothetical protein
LDHAVTTIRDRTLSSHRRPRPFVRTWREGSVLERIQRGDADLRRAFASEVKARTAGVSVPEALIGLDCKSFARKKVAPMVRGLLPIVEQQSVLDILARSLVFLTPSTIDAVLNKGFPRSAWDLANLYLLSCGAKLLADDAPRIVGMSEDTTCFVSMDYFRSNHRFAYRTAQATAGARGGSRATG